MTGYRVYQYAGISSGGSVKNDVQRLYTSAMEMRKEIQRIEIEHAASGTFTILMTYTDEYGEAQSEATSPLTLDASANDVEIALNSLFQSSSNGVTVTKDPLESSWNVTFEDEGDVSLLVIETGLLLTDGSGSPSSTVTTLQDGISSIGGDFRLSFQGEETENIPFDASDDTLKATLEALTNIGRVSVTSQDLTVTGTKSWSVEFLTNSGNLPLLVPIFGRLTGSQTRLFVEKAQQGSESTLVYDGVKNPTSRRLLTSDLNDGTAYAYRVAAINVVGEGVLSPATPVVIARDGASPAFTTASGSSLTQSMAGVVHEVQSVETSGSGSFTLSSSDGLSTTQGLDIETTTSSQLESALNSILGASSVHVTRHEASDTSSTGHLYYVTFVGLAGNQNLLLGSTTGAGTSISIDTFVQGEVNEFTIEPTKASGHPLKDVTALDGFEGLDVFFTEIWSSDSSVSIPTPEQWIADGGVATYNNVRYETQVIRTSSATGGATFRLELDTSSRFTGGEIKQTQTLSHDISEDDLKFEIEQMLDSFSHFQHQNFVTVTRTHIDQNDYEWTVVFVSTLGDLPEMTGSFVTGSGAVVVTETQKGVTEIQSITSVSDTEFVEEIQTIATSSATSVSGTFDLSYDNSDPITVTYNEDASSLETLLETIDGIEDVTVTEETADTAHGVDAKIWYVTFHDPVGAQPRLVAQADAGFVGDITIGVSRQGSSPISGTFVVEYGIPERYTTNDLPFDISASAMKSALEGLPSIGSVDVRILLLALRIISIQVVQSPRKSFTRTF